MKLFSALFSIALLTACSAPDEGEGVQASVEDRPTVGWKAEPVDDGIALIYDDAEGVEMRFSCYGDPPLLGAFVRGFERTDGEGRIDILLGERALTMSVELNRPPGEGIFAITPLPVELAGPLRGAESISARYAGETREALPAPSEEAVEALLTSCEEYGPVE